MMTAKETSQPVNQSTGKPKTGRIFVISAPSGCGKTTLLKRLLREEGLKLVHSISMTSRPPREDETEGVDYYFVSKESFKEKIEKGEFLEWEENFGNFYGTPKKFVDCAIERGENILLSIDVKGATNIRKVYPKESTLIFILPPSLEELEERLKKRKTDESYVISKRLKIAKDEIVYKDRYDYSIVNDNLASAYDKLKNIIKEKLG